MKLVRESLQNFDRGVSVKHGLGVGSYALIKKWFEEFAPDAEYEIDDDLNISVGGSLFLGGTNITSLPDNLSVGGSLYLYNSNIISLSDDLNVGGNLYLRDTNISSLPDNLTVGERLNIMDTKITSLPDDLRVGGQIDKDF